MRRQGLVVLAVAATLAGGAIVGCEFFTGSTDGYEPSDAGAPAQVVDGACLADGGFCLELECTSASDCARASDGGSAADQICCLGFLSTTTIGTSCQVSSCSLGTIQSCSTITECTGGTSCVLQSCNPTSNSLTFQACGLVPGCALVTPASGDAGAQDSAAQDSAAQDSGGQDSGASDAGITDAGGLDSAG